MCMWFECPKMDNGMTHIENWVHRSRQRISFVTQMDGLIDALLTENNMSILELFDSNMVVKDTSIKTVPEKLKACQKKVGKGCGRWEIGTFLLVRMNFMRMEGIIASEDVPKYQFVFKLFVALRHVSTDLQNIWVFPKIGVPQNGWCL